MADLAILFPVLGRPQRVRPLLESLRAATPPVYRVLFIADEADTGEQDAIREAGEEMLIHDGTFAQKINAGYRATTEPFLFMGADDLYFRKDWYPRAMVLFDDPAVQVVGTNDIANPRVMCGQHSTHSLFRRGYIQQQSGVIDAPDTVLCEQYPHEYCDDEFIQTAMSRGAYRHAFDSIVEHLHPLVGQHPDALPDDDTYRLGRAKTRLGRLKFRQRRHLWQT